MKAFSLPYPTEPVPAGMGGLNVKLTHLLGVPCIDAVAAGVRFAEMLVGMKLQTSKWMTYRAPEPKVFKS